MSKLTKQQEEQIDELAEMFDDTLGDDDYCFILGPDGEMKSIMIPDNVPFDLPENVSKLLTVFNINPMNIAGNSTLH